MSGIPTRQWQLWTAAQQKTLLALCLILLVYLGVQTLRQPRVEPDPPPRTAPRENEVQDRLDPNTAEAAELSAIPGLGENHARDIAAFRDTFLRAHPGARPFHSAEDLMLVKGIGPGISSNCAPYLMFNTR
jgi:DNA uptake protein ComE-like DNA-binding protein